MSKSEGFAVSRARTVSRTELALRVGRALSGGAVWQVWPALSDRVRMELGGSVHQANTCLLERLGFAAVEGASDPIRVHEQREMLAVDLAFDASRGRARGGLRVLLNGEDTVVGLSIFSPQSDERGGLNVGLTMTGGRATAWTADREFAALMEGVRGGWNVRWHEHGAGTGRRTWRGRREVDWIIGGIAAEERRSGARIPSLWDPCWTACYSWNSQAGAIEVAWFAPITLRERWRFHGEVCADGARGWAFATDKNGHRGRALKTVWSVREDRMEWRMEAPGGGGHVEVEYQRRR